MLGFDVECTAMFWLERYFIQYPEFRDFAAAVGSPMIKPRRKILSIFINRRGLPTIDEPDGRFRAYPDNHESEMLLLIVEKFRGSREKTDQDAIWSAMERVWRAHRPDILLQEPEEELDEDLGEEPDDVLDGEEPAEK